MNVNEFEPWQNTYIKFKVITALAREHDLYDLLNGYLDCVIDHLTFHAKREVTATFEEFDLEDENELDGQMTIDDLGKDDE